MVFADSTLAAQSEKIIEVFDKVASPLIKTN